MNSSNQQPPPSSSSSSPSISQIPPALPGVDINANRAPTAMAIISVVMVFVVLAVAARLYARHLKGNRLSASDYTILAAFTGCLVNSALGLYSPQVGLGRHVQVVPPEYISRLMLQVYIGELLYAFTISVTKISILLLYRSLFPTPGMRLATSILGILSVVWAITVTFMVIFFCSPIPSFWDLSVKEPVCIDAYLYLIGSSVPNVVIDAAILCLPIPKVWNLKLPVRQKLAVCSMFLLGGFVCVISILRILELLSFTVFDPTWSFQPVFIWATMELDVAVICACLPTLRPILSLVFPDWLTSVFNTAAGRSAGRSGGTGGVNKNTIGGSSYLTSPKALYCSSPGGGPGGSISVKHTFDVDNFQRLPEYPLNNLHNNSNNNNNDDDNNIMISKEGYSHHHYHHHDMDRTLVGRDEGDYDDDSEKGLNPLGIQRKLVPGTRNVTCVGSPSSF